MVRRNPRVIHDPSLLELGNLIADEAAAKEYAQQNGLLPVVNNVPCSFTAGCTGMLKQTTVRDKGKDRPIWRCGRCKKKRSVLNGSAIVGGQGNNTFFARKDTLDRPCARIGIRAILMLIWCWSQKFTIAQHKDTPFLEIMGEIANQYPQ